MRNFLKLCLVGTIVAGGVVLTAQDCFAATKKKNNSSSKTTTSMINAAAPAVGRVGASLIQGNTSSASKAATSGVTNVVKKGVSAVTGNKAAGNAAGRVTKAAGNKLTGATGKSGGGASSSTTRAAASAAGKGGSSTSSSGGASLTKLQTGTKGTPVIQSTTTPKTYNIAEVSSAAGTGQTSVVTDFDTGLKTIATQNGTFQETSTGVFTKVSESSRFMNDGELVSYLGNQTKDITLEGGVIDSVVDPKTLSITDTFGNEFSRTDGGWVQTKFGAKTGDVSSGVKGWKEGEIYKGSGERIGTTEVGGGIYKDGAQIIQTNDVGEITNVSYDVKLSDGKAVKVGDTIYSDGKFSKVSGINPDGSLKLENGTTVNPSDSLSTFSSKGLDGADVTYAQGADGSTIVGSDGSEYKLNPETKQWEQTAEGKVDEAKAKAAEAAAAIDTGNETNAIQYAILILQAIEGMHQEDATREVTVEGAQKLQDSQGAPQNSEIIPDTSLDGSNLSCAASSLAYLLQGNPVSIELMDVSDLDPTTTAGEIAIKNRRNQLLQEYAVSAAIISAGSNAISSQFHTRVSQLAATASSTTGTLGSMSVLNDSERYPYFEMVRQVALSGVQLGLKGASTLSHVIVGSVLPEKDEENGASGGDSGKNTNPENGSEGNK